MAIPNNIATIHHTGNVLEDIHAGMRPEDFPHLAALLTDLYSDPIAAIVREYPTNAWDSHIAAGSARPIEITLPTLDNLEFIIEDFGLGLSIDDLRDVYSMYGRSLKRDSNDFAGQLGLGCKSGLSYAEAFTISAVKEGVKVVAVSTKDEHGVGVIKVLDTLGTDEANGVRIAIPVERYDVHRFKTAADNFFQFWTPGSVLIDGEAPAIPEWMNGALYIDEDVRLVRKDAGLNTSYVIMGNVAYPVPDAENPTRHGVSRRFVARLNIGDVDFVPSREDVRHTPHTDATLAALTEHISLRFKPVMDKAIESTTTRWEETLLRVVWKDARAAIRTNSDRPIWVYTPTTSWGRKAASHLGYSVQNLSQSNLVVITGFTSKNVSTTARERLTQFCGERRTFVIVPTSVSTAMLDGRPNTYTWDEVVAGTSEVRADKVKVKREKVETQYAIYQGGSMTADELAEVAGTVLYLRSGCSATYGSLDATVVCLYSDAQLPRIKRYVPNIREYDTEVEAARARALAAITDEDRALVRAKTLSGAFTEMDHTKVDDPALAEAIRLNKASLPVSVTVARNLNCAVNHKPLENFDKKYPLAANRYGAYGTDRAAVAADLLLYVNAKYAASLQLSLDSVAS